ncbi:hypothetical protein CRG98_040298 [Punica granatum]|uniref:Uncharacterized protein n=1 Tax=Punica granatum TaxID=22663 RepID=A0A2I0I5Q5_PUNGR|nr:hypothetical protein CRG98_040298 [Punica granatum]
MPLELASVHEKHGLESGLRSPSTRVSREPWVKVGLEVPTPGFMAEPYPTPISVSHGFSEVEYDFVTLRDPLE